MLFKLKIIWLAVTVISNAKDFTDTSKLFVDFPNSWPQLQTLIYSSSFLAFSSKV